MFGVRIKNEKFVAERGCGFDVCKLILRRAESIKGNRDAAFVDENAPLDFSKQPPKDKIGDGSIKESLDAPLKIGAFGVSFLQFSSGSFSREVDIEFSRVEAVSEKRVVKMKDFRPDLPDGVVVVLGRKLLRVAFKNEKTSGAGLVTKEFVIVGGGGENALTREFVGASSVLKTRAINLSRNEGFDLLVLSLFGGLHFGQFDDPQTLKSFDDVVVGNGIKLTEPVTAELPKNGRLADALFALQNEAIIEFASRMKNACNGGG